MERIETTYKLKFEDESQLSKLLQENGYRTIENSRSAYGAIIANEKKIGRIRDGTWHLLIEVFVHTEEGRNLDKLLAEWTPEKKSE